MGRPTRAQRSNDITSRSLSDVPIDNAGYTTNYVEPTRLGPSVHQRSKADVATVASGDSGNFGADTGPTAVGIETPLAIDRLGVTGRVSFQQREVAVGRILMTQDSIAIQKLSVFEAA